MNKSRLPASWSDDLRDFADLEARIVIAAAQYITEPQKRAMQLLGDTYMRCAVVGDIETNLVTDKNIEVLIGQAARLEGESLALYEKKYVFKQNWQMAYRLKDTLPFAQMRLDQIEQIVSGNGEAAAAISHSFFETLRDSLQA